jgi:hypothetical protein
MAGDWRESWLFNSVVSEFTQSRLNLPRSFTHLNLRLRTLQDFTLDQSTPFTCIENGSPKCKKLPSTTQAPVTFQLAKHSTTCRTLSSPQPQQGLRLSLHHPPLHAHNPNRSIAPPEQRPQWLGLALLQPWHELGTSSVRPASHARPIPRHSAQGHHSRLPLLPITSAAHRYHHS